MGHLELQCPHCEKRLRLSDEHAGKMIRCPACKQTLIVEAPELPRPVTPRPAASRQSADSSRGSSGSAPRRNESTSPRPRSSISRPPASRSARRDEGARSRQRQEFDEYDATPWDDGNDIEDYDDPFAPQTVPKRRRAKSELPGKLLKVGLFLFLVLLIVGSVGGLGYFAFQQFAAGRSMSGNKLNMAWFPQNVEAVVYMQPAEVAQSAFFRKLTEKAPAQAGLKMKNFEPSDIESILMGFWAEAGSIDQVPGALTNIPFGIDGGWQNGAASLTVVRLKRDGLLPPGQKLREYQGKTIYNDSIGMVSCPVDSRTILLGSEKAVIAAIDRNGVEYHQPKLSHIPMRGHMIVAGVNNRAGGSAATNLPAGNPVEQIGQLMSENAKSAAVVADFSDDLSLTAIIKCHDESGAVRVETELKASIEKARQQMGLVTAFMPIQGLGEVLTEMLNSSRIGRSADELILSAEVPSRLLDMVPANNVGPPSMAPSGSRF